MNTQTKLRKLNGNVVEIDAPKRKRSKSANRIATRKVVQRFRLPDGTLQEVEVTERRSQLSHDRMVRRERLNAETTAEASDGISSTVIDKEYPGQVIGDDVGFAADDVGDFTDVTDDIGSDESV